MGVKPGEDEVHPPKYPFFLKEQIFVAWRSVIILGHFEAPHGGWLSYLFVMFRSSLVYWLKCQSRPGDRWQICILKNKYKFIDMKIPITTNILLIL